MPSQVLVIEVNGIEHSLADSRVAKLVLPTWHATDRDEVETSFIDPLRNSMGKLLANGQIRRIVLLHGLGYCRKLVLEQVGFYLRFKQGRARPSRRAERRAWNTCDSARWGQARPTEGFLAQAISWTANGWPVGRDRPGEPIDELGTRVIRLAGDRLALPKEDRRGIQIAQAFLTLLAPACKQWGSLTRRC